MSIIQLQDLYLKPYINKDEIASIVKELALKVKADLPKGEIPLFVGILNGCFLFAADFIREFNGDCEVSFVKLASYNGTSSTENVLLKPNSRSSCSKSSPSKLSASHQSWNNMTLAGVRR